MSAPRTEILAPPVPEVVADEIPRRRAEWIETATGTDHKVVGRLYLATAFSFLVFALVELVLIRMQLAVSANTLLRPEIFNEVLSVYGITAVMLFGLPVAAGFASYLVPLQIGARGVAFPRLNALSYWLYLAGGVTVYATFLYSPSEAGTIALPPLSDDAFLPFGGVDAWIVGAALVALSSICFGINMEVTVRRMRAPGLAWRRLPPFSVSAAVYAFVAIVISAVFLAALAMLFVDRHFSGEFFEPAQGGAPYLYEHLAWLYFTGAYFLMLIPAFGAISEILPAFSRKPLFGHGAVCGSLVAIGVLGPLAWMQNMYAASIPIGVLYAAMAVAMLLVIPISLLLFNWIATLWRGSLRMRAPLIFALGAIGTYTVGATGELAHSLVAVGQQLGGSTDSTGGTHFALVGGSVLGMFAALYYWFPKITGRTMGEGLARASFWLTLLGIYLTFAPMLMAGLEGQPVDVYKYFEGEGLEGYNLASAVGSVVLAIGVLLTLVNAVLSVRGGTLAGHDPWLGGTLEWFTTSPPPENNFDVVPDVRSTEPMSDIRTAIGRDKESEPA